VGLNRLDDEDDPAVATGQSSRSSPGRGDAVGLVVPPGAYETVGARNAAHGPDLQLRAHPRSGMIRRWR